MHGSDIVQHKLQADQRGGFVDKWEDGIERTVQYASQTLSALRGSPSMVPEERTFSVRLWGGVGLAGPVWAGCSTANSSGLPDVLTSSCGLACRARLRQGGWAVVPRPCWAPSLLKVRGAESCKFISGTVKPGSRCEPARDG